MMGLFDTSILLDYLAGDERARDAVAAYDHRALTALSWLELMTLAPNGAQQDTAGFLRTFERLVISESIVEEAYQLVQVHSGLGCGRATQWAAARANRLIYVTVDPAGLQSGDNGIHMPYRWATPRG